MISAERARQMTEEVLQNGIKEEMNKLENAIMNAINKGESYTTIDGSFSKATKKALENMGYHVESNSHYNESYLTIKW